MLNIFGLMLAAAILPTEFALLRIAGGIIVGVFVTYGVSVLATRWVATGEAEARRGKLFEWSSKVIDAYSKLFRFDRLFSGGAVDSPTALISSWMGMAWRLARVIVPLIVVVGALSVYIVRLIPDTGNNILGVAVMSFFSTLFMIPTWTEIPFAAALIGKGLSGLAATALITLPAVSLPSLVIIAGAVRSLKVAVLLGLSVFLVGIVAGIILL